ncbi:MAG: prepilin peptidase [Acidimicrobiales bacterium]|nr:prepilin peptidase [Acidimicrobiales bacterium]
MTALVAVAAALAGLVAGRAVNAVIASSRGVDGVEAHDVPGVVLPPWACVVATAVLFAAGGARFGPEPELLAYLFLFAVLVAVSAIDLEQHRIPNRIVFPALAVSVPAVVVVSIARDVPGAIRWALVGAVVYAGVLLVFHLVSPAGIGFGDVKLGLVLGLYLGWLDLYLVLVGLALGALVGAAVGLGILAAVGWRQGRRTGFPFGPALAAGTVIAVLFSQPILGAVGPG